MGKVLRKSAPQDIIKRSIFARFRAGGAPMEKVKRTPASLKKMVETFGMEILHRGSDYDSAVITIPT